MNKKNQRFTDFDDDGQFACFQLYTVFFIQLLLKQFINKIPLKHSKYSMRKGVNI